MAMSDVQLEEKRVQLMAVLAERRDVLRLRFEELEVTTGLQANYIRQLFSHLKTPSLPALILLADALDMDIELKPREGKEVPPWMLRNRLETK